MHGVVDQSYELLPLLVRDGGAEVLNFDETLADENNLGDFIDARHPRIADKLRIQCGNASRLFWISGRGGLPFQKAWCAVEFANGVDVSYEVVTRTESSIEPNLLC